MVLNAIVFEHAFEGVHDIANVIPLLGTILLRLSTSVFMYWSCAGSSREQFSLSCALEPLNRSKS